MLVSKCKVLATALFASLAHTYLIVNVAQTMGPEAKRPEDTFSNLQLQGGQMRP